MCRVDPGSIGISRHKRLLHLPTHPGDNAGYPSLLPTIPRESTMRLIGSSHHTQGALCAPWTQSPIPRVYYAPHDPSFSHTQRGTMRLIVNILHTQRGTMRSCSLSHTQRGTMRLMLSLIHTGRYTRAYTSHTHREVYPGIYHPGYTQGEAYTTVIHPLHTQEASMRLISPSC